VTPTQAEIRRAASLLRAGKLVAFPTETVYGLGANAFDAAAVARIFEAKGRPRSSPIIVHVNSMEMAKLVVREWPPSAQTLASTLWPGPLTLVLHKQPSIPDLVTAGLDTVGVRMPAHPIALALIDAAQVPVAAPSANRFTELSPTIAEHVRESLGDRVDYILDGGPCTVGIESTVLSVVTEPPTLLRPGGLPRQQIEGLIGPISGQPAQFPGPHPSPGMHPRHYSPRTYLVLAPDGVVPTSGRGAYIQVRHPPAGSMAKCVQMPADPAGYATHLYFILHQLDSEGYDWIAVEPPPSSAEWEAVLDRLRRAASESH